MFDDQTMLTCMNGQTRAAVAKFMKEMRDFSATISSRNLDANSLSQGMQFLWKGLDLGVKPWSVSM